MFGNGFNPCIPCGSYGWRRARINFGRMQSKPKPTVELNWFQVPQRVPILKKALHDAKGNRQAQTVVSKPVDSFCQKLLQMLHNSWPRLAIPHLWNRAALPFTRKQFLKGGSKR